MKPIPPGAKGTHAKLVAAADLASKLDPSLAAVLSTPTMIAMMELAAIDAIRSYDDGRNFRRHGHRSAAHRGDAART